MVHFVRRLYHELLGRTPESADLKYFLELLRAGTPREDVTLLFAKSDEYRTLVRDALYTPPYPPHVVEHSYGRSRLAVCTADEIASEWYDTDWPEVPELDFLGAHRLKPSATVYDLGAHQGVYSLVLSSYVGDAGLVLAVEPDPFNAGLIDVNRRLNGSPPVVTVLAAAAEHSGSLNFGRSRARGSNGQVDGRGASAGSVIVPAVSVDDLAQKFPPPDVVIVDVEGYECHVLRGASATLSRCVDWHVEIHTGAGLEDFGGSIEAVVDFFPESRFCLYLSNETFRYPKPLTPDLLREFSGERLYLTAISKDVSQKA